MTVKFLGAIAAAIITFSAVPAFADCTAPSKAVPSIPDGATASEADMKAASAAVKGFMADMQDYMKCMEFANAANSPKYTAAQDQLTTLAADFNKQLRAYKSK